MKNSRAYTKFISGALAGAMIPVSPSLPAYQAFAVETAPATAGPAAPMVQASVLAPLLPDLSSVNLDSPEGQEQIQPIVDAVAKLPAGASREQTMAAMASAVAAVRAQASGDLSKLNAAQLKQAERYPLLLEPAQRQAVDQEMARRREQAVIGLLSGALGRWGANTGTALPTSIGLAASQNDGRQSRDYLERAPDLPLPNTKPGWEPSGAPSAQTLKYRSENSASPESLGYEFSLGTTETLAPEAIANPFKDLTPDEPLLGYGRRLHLEVTSGLKQAGLVGEDMVWIDGEGRLNVYNWEKDRTTVIKAPLGPIGRLVTLPHSRTIYVLAGGMLQRWDLDTQKARILSSEKVASLTFRDLAPLRSHEGLEVKTDQGRLTWVGDKVSLIKGGEEALVDDNGAAVKARQDGEFYLESAASGTRVWRNSGADGSAVVDLGTLPFSVKAIQAFNSRDTIYAVSDEGLIEWDTAKRRYRRIPIDGLSAALSGLDAATLNVSLDGQRVLVAAGQRLFYVDLADHRGERESTVRAWSDDNPMFVKDGLLRIGDFAFPVQMPARAPWHVRLLNRLLGRPEPSFVPAISENDWKALNLPSNKWTIYQTLKSFSLGQHALYIGETGGGKTWISEKIAALVGRKLYSVSFTEYTKNQDLLYSRTFGEEGKNRTGKTYETVLQWLSAPRGGVLLLDEMHKPLEGIAALNNVLQNLKYHLGGRDIVGDRSTHFVIGTMNPVKPPYKGEPPSGELSSRFGVTLEVNYLPPSEEAALLKIFYPGVGDSVAKRLVNIANDLRKAYPDVLPLPVSTRTLLFVVEKMLKFSKDDPTEAFTTTYNPSTIVLDPSIAEAIKKVLAAHDLAGALGQKKKQLGP